MRLRTVIEAAILAVFLITTLAAIMWYNIAVPTDAEDGGNAKEYVQSGDQLYAAGSLKFNAAAVKYWEAIKRDPNLAGARFRLAAIYFDKAWNYQPLHLLEELERTNPQYPGLYLLLGKIHDRMQNTDKAFNAFQKAVAVQPEIRGEGRTAVLGAVDVDAPANCPNDINAHTSTSTSRRCRPCG